MSTSLNIPKIRLRISSADINTGYGNATRNIAESLHNSEIPTVFDSNDAFFNDKPKPTGKYKINLHVKPLYHVYPRHTHDADYNIAYFYWETDLIHEEWAEVANSIVDELWVPCRTTAKACRKAGFSGPIEIVHTPIDYHSHYNDERISSENYISEDNKSYDSVYIFYSIFQWHYRKGYDKLLQAYYEEFSSDDNVLLIMKTLPIPLEGHGKIKIKKDLQHISELYYKNNMPKMYVIKDPVQRSSIKHIHDIGDCFVLPHRGEGWGMPIHEAANEGNLIITTKFGGITERLNNLNSMIIDSKLKQVECMDWARWYQPNQNWADPSVTHLKKLMRKAYNAGKGGYQNKKTKVEELGKSMNRESFAESVKKILLKERFKNMI